MCSFYVDKEDGDVQLCLRAYKDREGFKAKTGFTLLSPEMMAEPTLFLCSDQAGAVRDERISAKDFPQWHAHWLERNPAPAVGV